MRMLATVLLCVLAFCQLGSSLLINKRFRNILENIYSNRLSTKLMSKVDSIKELDSKRVANQLKTNAIRPGVISTMIFVSSSTLICGPSRTLATAEEALQLLDGYHNIVPENVALFVCLAGAYLMQYRIYKWMSYW